MKIGIYARVSTSEQSVDSQLRDLKAFAEQRGFEIHKIYTDVGISGSVQKRPELDALMDDARKRKFNAVLVWRFDRFARSTKHLVSALEEFKSLGIGFLSYNENIDTSSSIGEAIFTIIAAMAQLERDIIRERVKAGLRAAKDRGKQLGRPSKTTNISEVVRLSREGKSIRQIAKELNMSQTTVHRTLKGNELTETLAKVSEN